MDDLDRLLAETMRDAAGRAPGDDGLLATVHRRSARLRRQRIVTGLSAAAAVLAVSVPTAAVLVTRTPAATTVATAPPVTPAVPAAVRLGPGFTAPVFPYALAPAAGLKAPVVSMRGGILSAFFEATELRHHADTTVTVSGREPVLAGPATGKRVSVRGHTGTLRTVDVRPAKRIVLTWPESPSRWIQLATDDTYTEDQVVALAEGMTAAAVALLPPFRLDLSPAGLAPDTVTASTMAFGGSPAGRLQVVLRHRRALPMVNEQVGPYEAALVRSPGGGVTVDVDVTDWDATLEVSAGAGLVMSDADLLRFAAGVHVLNRSDPQ